MANDNKGTNAKSKTKGFRINNPEKYEHAYFLYMEKTPQHIIAERVGVTTKTVSEWKIKGEWDAKRLSKSVSVDSLIAGVLQKANTLLQDDNFNADAFAKALAPLKKLKTHNTADEDINAFTRFGDWVIRNRQYHKNISEDFIKLVTQLQDAFIKERIAMGDKLNSF